MRLIYRRGREEVAFPIDEGETYIGRKEYCEIHLADGSLSKRHARLERRGSRLKVFDEGSRNGTRVNGERIDDCFLREGDELECGKVLFRVAGIPDKSGAEFDLIDDSRSRHSRSRGGGMRSTRSQPANQMLITARAVASTDARPSMLDVLPELPFSGEQDGFDEGPDDQPRARFRLVEGGPAQTWELSEETLTIGSKEENVIVLVGEGVSRYHAEVVFEDGLWFVKDLGARNGIFVAGEKVDIYELKDGDEVQIGTSRLRFELVKPDPLAELKLIIEKLKEDPVGTFKADARVRIAAASLVTLLLLTLMFLPGARQVVVNTGAKSGPADWLREGSDHLVAGRYSDARTVFLKAKANVSDTQQRIPRVLERVALLWGSLEKGPSSFRWEKAETLLKKDWTRLKGLPDNLRTWHASQTAFVDLNKASFAQIKKAEKTAKEADDLATRSDLDRALEKYDHAQAQADKVDRTSLFTDRADKVSSSVKRSAFRLLIRQARAVTRGTPDWARGSKLLKQATKYIAGPDDRKVVRELVNRFDNNARDERAYMKGVRIVRDRAVERYNTARELFESVSLSSTIHEDAKAYIEWIEADIAVRNAKTAYDLGQSQRAFSLLNDALSHEVLGEDAIDSVKRRHTSWSRVVRAWDRGHEHKSASEWSKARQEFLYVLQNEKNPRNSFHSRARLEIKSIDEIVKQTYERKVQNVMSALDRKDWGAVNLWAKEIQRYKGHDKADLARVRQRVAKANKDYRLLKRANREFMRDNVDAFSSMLTTLRMLTAWLPKGDKDRKDAKKLLERLLPRLKNMRDGARQNR